MERVAPSRSNNAFSPGVLPANAFLSARCISQASSVEEYFLRTVYRRFVKTVRPNSLPQEQTRGLVYQWR